MPSMNAPFNALFDTLSFFVPLMFVLVLALFLLILLKGLRQWAKNNRAPVLTVEAQIVNLREEAHSHHHTAADAHMLHHTSTTYYATFQVESGDRIELAVTGPQYGLLARGDAGRLTLQGTRFLGFHRH